MIAYLDLIESIAGRNTALTLAERYSTLHEIADAPPNELARIAGSGAARKIAAALQLSAAAASETRRDKPLIDSPDKVAELMAPSVASVAVEQFWVVLANTRRRLIKAVKASDGTLDTLLVHPREVFREAIISNASAIVLLHNHPSGDPTPSEADIRVTRDLIRAGQNLKIEVLDHVIIGKPTQERPKAWSSLRELGYFYT